MDCCKIRIIPNLLITLLSVHCICSFRICFWPRMPATSRRKPRMPKVWVSVLNKCSTTTTILISHCCHTANEYWTHHWVITHCIVVSIHITNICIRPFISIITYCVSLCWWRPKITSTCHFMRETSLPIAIIAISTLVTLSFMVWVSIMHC